MGIRVALVVAVLALFEAAAQETPHYEEPVPVCDEHIRHFANGAGICVRCAFYLLC